MSRTDLNATAAIAAADAAIDRASPTRHTLAPGRTRANTLAQVLRLLDPPPGELAIALALGLAEVAMAQLDAFPGNLFWDFDLMAAAVLAEARSWAQGDRHQTGHQADQTGHQTGHQADQADQAAIAKARLHQIAELQHLYGRETAIHFTYVHDFAYGYDWAKWIARDPPDRRDHGPYSATFLAYMNDRGHELLALIAADDHKYPTLTGEQPRNPFPFPREPASELHLHRELARRGEIPVEAWRIDAAPVWNRGYAAIRAERARALGLRLPPCARPDRPPADGPPP